MKKCKGGDSNVKYILLVIFFLLMIFITTSLLLLIKVKDCKIIKDSMEELIEDVIEENSEDKEKDSIIDWNRLEQINKDIIGWIKINETNINYPILKDSSDLYYLKHSYDKKYNSNGSIFTLNTELFKEKQTILYGHNMRNGIMFSELGNYLDYDFFEKHSKIEIFTKEQNYIATVFCCYSINVKKEENNIKNLSFEDEIEYYKKQSKYKKDVGNIEKIVKLNTCSYLHTNKRPTLERYFIIAKIENL